MSRFADIVSVENDPELGVITRVFGERPLKGNVPTKEILGHLDGAKSVLSFTVFLARNTPILPFLILFPGRRKKVIEYFANALRKNLFTIFEFTSINNLCRSGKEMARVMGLTNACDCKCHVDPSRIWTGGHDNCIPDPKREIFNVFALSFLLMFDFDDAYRYRFQDLLGEIHMDNLKLKPRKELRRVLDVCASREVDHAANRLLMFPKYKAGKSLILIMPKKWLNWLVAIITNLDMSKIELDEDDLSWAQHKFYNFRGRPYRNLVRNGQGFIVDVRGTGKYIPNGRDIIYSLSAINPHG